VTRIDMSSADSLAALEAEKRLFAYYGLEYRTHSIQLDKPNLRVRVLETGSGEPALMLPGGSGDAWQFAPLMAQLHGRRLIAVNRPGGGLSDGVDHRRIDMRELAIHVITLVIDGFGLPGVEIIANSMGGLWAFWFALAQPERTRRIVQMGCPALLLKTTGPLFLRLITLPVGTKIVQSAMRPRSAKTALRSLRSLGSTPESIAAMPTALAEAAYRFYNLPTYGTTWFTLASAAITLAGARPRYQFTADQLRRVHAPVQFLWGDRDPFGGLELARRAVELMPHASLHEMRTGHLPFLDAPVECGEMISNCGTACNAGGPVGSK
jgi:pimeloyl-ACP methyl ester carboxylesterase